MPRREECVFCGGTHGPRPTSHFVGGDVHIAPPPLARHRRAARLPLGGGCRRSRLGERKRRLLPFPLSALRAATSLTEGGKGRTDCRVASLLAMTALRAVGDGVLQWSAAEQMPLGYDIPSVGADGSVRPVRFAPRAVAKPCSIKKNRPRAVLFCLFRADRSGIRCRYRSRPGCSNSLSASQTRPRSHLPAD